MHYYTYRAGMERIQRQVKAAGDNILWDDFPPHMDATDIAKTGNAEAIVYVALCKAADEFAAVNHEAYADR